MTNKQLSFRNTAATIITNLEKRNMEGYFCESRKELIEIVLSQMERGSLVSFGGSESIKESGLLAQIMKEDFTVTDRMNANTPEEKKQAYIDAVRSDYYLMSSNAITFDGELINIDGNGNRVACLIHGPEHVMIIVGMNKLVTDIGSGLDRVRNIAAPPNAMRLGRNTPCKEIGCCSDCLSPDCMCCQMVITRKSMQKGRIKVFLVAEELGY